MNERRIDDLLRYLDALTRLKAEGEFICLNEIEECLREIRSELISNEKEPKRPPTVRSKVGVGFDYIEMDFYDLSVISTAQLADELAKREGVTEYFVGSRGFFSERIEGPARILINRD